MKNYVFIILISLTANVKGQCYTSLTQSQNKLLDTYKIDYTGLQTRYIMSTNRIDQIKDLTTKEGMIHSYSDFLKWKSPEIVILPDTTMYLFTGTDYVKNKSFMPESELIPAFFDSSDRVLQFFHFDIYKDDINTIEILECHLSSDKTCSRIYHMIFIENKYGYWSSFLSDDTDTTLDCPFCAIP
jgi:hypothetical protein